MTMECIYRDSFDYDEADLTVARGWTKTEASGGNVTIETSSPITGYASVRCDGSGGTARLRRQLPSTYASLSCRCRIRSNLTNANGENVFAFQSGGVGGTTQIAIFHGASGVLTVFAAGATRITTAAGVVTANTDHHIELIFKIANAGGFLELFVDGVSVGSYSGDTQDTSATVDTVQIHDTGANSLNCLYDDLSVWADDAAGDAVQMGPHRVGVKRPTGDTATEDWTPSAGTDSYAMVDEVTSDGDTTHLESATDTHKTRLTGEAVTGLAATIQGASVVCIARKTDAAARDILVGVAESASEEKSAAQALTTTFAMYQHYFLDTPGGSGIVPSDITDWELFIEANQ